MVYIDAFNFYFGAVKGTPYKWLDFGKFCRLLLPNNQIVGIRYFTARVRPLPHDPDQPTRQQIYWRALRTIPNFSLYEGHFL
ncbi:MAG TPA: NYN domain protein, partial [Methylomirabilota bacterium]|nr:NYN domain protein [Methylomirabilota bacterium]